MNRCGYDTVRLHVLRYQIAMRVVVRKTRKQLDKVWHLSLLIDVNLTMTMAEMTSVIDRQSRVQYYVQTVLEHHCLASSVQIRDSGTNERDTVGSQASR